MLGGKSTISCNSGERTKCSRRQRDSGRPECPTTCCHARPAVAGPGFSAARWCAQAGDPSGYRAARHRIHRRKRRRPRRAPAQARAAEEAKIDPRRLQSALRDYCYLQDLFVAEGARGKGVGTELIKRRSRIRRSALPSSREFRTCSARTALRGTSDVKKHQRIRRYCSSSRGNAITRWEAIQNVGR